MDFIAATNNEGKIREISAILSSLGCRCLSLSQLGIISDPDENGDSFDANAEIKARAVFEAADRKFAVIADDSGICVDALAGKPGVLSARYSGEHGNDEDNNDKLLLELRDIPWKQRTAHYAASVCAIFPDGRVIITHGYTQGKIGFERRGEHGFGYDPLFYARGNFTFAQMSEERKNAVSHRARALRKLAFILRDINKIRK